ncbi:MFS transporter [Georgenia sp. MJ173]|uniref:MFS transporter n=1 Tax=Georgenia sunbinii TaxID=3117728 RepID=UPI002F264389
MSAPGAASATARPTTAGIPARFWWWLTGAGLSMFGVQLLGFAMAWVAAGQSATLAGLVLVSVNLPRTLLLLVGGAVADRRGAWRVMIYGDGAMVLVTGGFALATWAWGPRPALLVGAALLIGTVDAFYLPAAGSMPRQLLAPEQLTRDMSARQVTAQLGGVLGAPLGGVVVTALGLATAAALNSATFAVMLVLLLVIRPRTGDDVERPSPAGRVPADGPVPAAGRAPAAGCVPADGRATAGSGVVAAAVDGLRLAVGDRLLRAALVLLAGTAALLLPVVPLLLPVLARQHGWDATGTGVVAGTAGGTVAAVAVLVMVRGGFRLPGVAACAGLMVSAAGTALLAVGAAGGPVAVLAAVLVGAGTGLFSTNLGPLVLGSTPPAYLARLQSVVTLAQSLPLVIANGALGAAADAVGAAAALLGCAVGLVVIAGWALLATPLRSVSR